MKAQERSQGSRRESQEGRSPRAQCVCSAATWMAPTFPVRPPAPPDTPAWVPPAPELEEAPGGREGAAPSPDVAGAR